MKVAIATQDLTRVDGHFGRSRHVVVYDVSAEGHRLVLSRFFPLPSGPEQQAQSLPDCDLLFAAGLVPGSDRTLAACRVMTVLSFSGAPLATVLDSLRDGLRQGATRWLRDQSRPHHPEKCHEAERPQCS